MDFLASLADSVPLLVVTVVGGWLLHHRFERLESRVDRLEIRLEAGFDSRPTRDEMNARFDEMNARFDRLEAEIGRFRSDLTQIALALGAVPRPQTG